MRRSMAARSEVTYVMAKKFPLNPAHPERICWGCDRYCPTESLACGNGADRTQHPSEVWGDDWHTFGGWKVEGDTAVAVEPQALIFRG